MKCMAIFLTCKIALQKHKKDNDKIQIIKDNAYMDSANIRYFVL